MKYHIDAEKTNLNDIMMRIEETDLIPSRVCLKDEINLKFEKLSQHGIQTLAELRNCLKTPKCLEALSSESGIDPEYLNLLRREIESYFPKPSDLKEFNWFPLTEISKLEKNGIRNTADFYEAAFDVAKRSDLANTLSIDPEILDALFKHAELTRVQWVSPLTARMLVECSYETVSRLAEADPDELYGAMKRINEERGFFKGQIGLRDINRLIRAAGYA
ncbi:MAG: DUF4332 domain-containing protein [Flexilinea sp.]